TRSVKARTFDCPWIPRLDRSRQTLDGRHERFAATLNAVRQPSLRQHLGELPMECTQPDDPRSGHDMIDESLVGFLSGSEEANRLDDARSGRDFERPVRTRDSRRGRRKVEPHASDQGEGCPHDWEIATSIRKQRTTSSCQSATYEGASSFANAPRTIATLSSKFRREVASSRTKRSSSCGGSGA